MMMRVYRVGGGGLADSVDQVFGQHRIEVVDVDGSIRATRRQQTALLVKLQAADITSSKTSLS